MREPILIMGSGGMACLFAARLSAAGYDVSMLSEWEQGIAALNQSGVRLIDKQGRSTSYPVKAASRPQSLTKHNYAIVLVKSWQTRQAAGMLADCLASDGIALTLQNGLGNMEALAEVLGAHRTLCGSTTIGATLVSPGMVQTGGTGQVILPSLPTGHIFEKIFTNCGITVRLEQDIEGIIWGKLIINSAVNPITALLDVPNGFLLENNNALQLVHNVARESARVACAGNISLPFNDPIGYIEQVISLTAENSSSMRQDLKRNAPTEIDAITGEVISHGQKWGIETPFNQTLYHLVRARVG